MNTPGVLDQSDALLLPFLRAEGEAAESLLGQLIAERAAPIIKGIIKSKMHVSLRVADGSQQNQDALEIYSEVNALLIAALRRLKTDQHRPINNLGSYIAVITYHACYEHLRRKYPQRHSLKNRLRYLFTHRAEFALWESAEAQWLCGLVEWRDKRRPPASGAGLQKLRDGVQASGLSNLSVEDVKRMPPDALALTILKEAGAPLDLDEMVGLFAELQGLTEQQVEVDIDEETGEALYERIPDPRASVAAELDQRAYVERLWKEICQLPSRQRAALMLNLRDAQGHDMIALLPVMNVATIRQIAEALSIPAAEFAALWNDLPLDDASIAKRLGITRQQVINLRKSARERLARRMKNF
jgi:hypothetical protein